MCAEVLFAKSPHSFWVRLEENRTEYEEMLNKLQTEYENAHEELISKYFLIKNKLFHS